MAKFMFKGLDELESQLSQLATSDSIRAVCGATIYAGADVVANEIRKGIDALPVVDHRVKGSEDHKIAGLTSAQKKGLQESFGITPLSQEDGYYNVKLGFDGYNSDLLPAENPICGSGCQKSETPSAAGHGNGLR